MNNLWQLPEGWKWVKLGEVADIKQGKQLSSKEPKEGKQLRPFLRVSNIGWNKIDLSKISYMYVSDREFKRLRLVKGDVLICEGGEVGRTAVWEGEIEDCIYQNHIHRVRVDGERLLNYFLSYYMEYATKYLKIAENQASKTAIPNLSGSKLKQFLLPLPPLHEQKRIVQYL